MIAIGTDVSGYNWYTQDLIAKWLYENQIGGVGKGKYFSRQDKDFWAGLVPDHGAMMLDLYNIEKVNPAIRDSQPTMTGSQYVVDSWCGLAGSYLTREDQCGSITGPLLQGCTQFNPINAPLPKKDDFHAQTCIHDHSCTLSLMGISRMPGFVYAPGWNMLKSSGASKVWPQVDFMKTQYFQGWTQTPSGDRSATASIYSYYDIAVGDYPDNWGYNEDNTKVDLKNLLRNTMGFWVPFKDELPVQVSLGRVNPRF